MSQFPDARFDPYGEAVGQRKTSGLAISALVLSLLGLIPCCGIITAPIGLILGLIGVFTIGRNPMVKGRGLAFAAVIIGLILTIVWVVVLYVGFQKFYRPILVGPAPALQAGFAGDIAGFKSSFHGAGATASDDEARQFIDALRSRYGNFTGTTMQGQTAGSAGQPQATFSYRFAFANQSLNGEAEMIFADQSTGQFVMKWSYITIVDPSAGNVTYPPMAAGAGSGTITPVPQPPQPTQDPQDSAADDDQ